MSDPATMLDAGLGTRHPEKSKVELNLRKSQ